MSNDNSNQSPSGSGKTKSQRSQNKVYLDLNMFQSPSQQPVSQNIAQSSPQGNSPARENPPSNHGSPTVGSSSPTNFGLVANDNPYQQQQYYYSVPQQYVVAANRGFPAVPQQSYGPQQAAFAQQATYFGQVGQFFSNPQQFGIYNYSPTSHLSHSSSWENLTAATLPAMMPSSPARQSPTNIKPFFDRQLASERFQPCMIEVMNKDRYILLSKVIDLYKTKFDIHDPEIVSQLSYLEESIHLRDLSMDINCYIDAYYDTSPVKLVFECERFVLKQLNDKMKKTNNGNVKSSFLDFGIGEFLYNPYLMQRFGYSIRDIPNLPKQLTMEDIVTTYLDILAGTMNKTSSRAVNNKQTLGPIIERSFEIPKEKAGQVIGSKGSNLRLIEDQTGVQLQVHPSGNEYSAIVHVRGQQEYVTQANSLVMQVIQHGQNILRVQYQHRFEQNLRFRLKTKYQLDNVEALGIVIDAKAMHLRLVEHTREFTDIFKALSNEYSCQMRMRIPTLWREWSIKQTDLLMRSHNGALVPQARRVADNHLRNLIGEEGWKLLNQLRDAIPLNAGISMKSVVSDILTKLSIGDLVTFFSSSLSDQEFWIGSDMDFIPITKVDVGKFKTTISSLAMPLLKVMMWLGVDASKLSTIAVSDLNLLDSYLKILSISDIPESIQSNIQRTVLPTAMSCYDVNVQVGPTISSMACDIKIQEERNTMLDDDSFMVSVGVGQGMITMDIQNQNSKIFPLNRFQAFRLCDQFDTKKDNSYIASDQEHNFVAALEKICCGACMLFILHNKESQDIVFSPQLISLLKYSFGIQLDDVLPQQATRFYLGYYQQGSSLLGSQYTIDVSNRFRVKLIKREYLSSKCKLVLSEQ